MKEEVEAYVGKVGAIQEGELKILVEVLDYKKSYGRDRFLVTPLEGSGKVWKQDVQI